MSEVRRINDQLKRAFEGTAWHGDSLTEILAGVTAEQAAAKPIAGGHSIWELVAHITYWEDIGRKRINGDEAKYADADDWKPIVDTSETAWQAALDQLRQSNQTLRDTIATLTDEQLKEKAAGQEYSIYFLLHGVIQHDLYHAGQISLLKRASRT
jgi:uncharacterized damage-inducible protein DinB